MMTVMIFFNVSKPLHCFLQLPTCDRREEDSEQDSEGGGGIIVDFVSLSFFSRRCIARGTFSYRASIRTGVRCLDLKNLWVLGIGTFL